ncbi:hypothetical protein [Nocardioides mesophilus]|uniref:O-antigen ligase family protein n=1 Tax=Nocardioides mesophilus TaxID=433659 RepID=A0A7G9REF6_9ACTN|nr:hypothetical protein [Nocardioides mesophilus]QNN53981.1 hypothetical protein H9L09_06260 [Nocardioides mesophilus]
MLLVATTFLSRMSIPVGGLNLRFEMLACLVALVGLLAFKSRERGAREVGLVGLLALWLAWLSVVSLTTSPSPADSLVIIAWLALDLVAVMFLLWSEVDVAKLALFGVRAAVVSTAVGVVCWILATLGIARFLVQVDPAYGGYAAFAGFYEANIFAGAILLWACVAQSRRLSYIVSPGLGFAVLVCAPTAALISHTRAAFVGSALLVLAVFWKNRSAVVFWFVPSAIIAASVLPATLLNSLNLDKFAELLDFSEGTGRYRAATWERALIDLRDQSAWFSGLGLNSFGQRHLDPSLPGSGQAWYLGSLPLQILYDGGLVSVALLASIALAVYWRWRSKNAAVFLAAYLVVGASTSTLWLLQTWVFVGMAIATSKFSGPASPLGTSIELGSDRGLGTDVRASV